MAIAAPRAISDLVAGVRGWETNIGWHRLDDGSEPGRAVLRRGEVSRLGPRDVATVLPADIHSISNDTGEVTLSLHAYGRHLNDTQRSRYDPETGRVEPFVIAVR